MAKAAARLHHPHIVTVYKFDESNGYYYCAMELVDGLPLNELLTDEGMSLPDLLEIGVAVASALGAAHVVERLAPLQPRPVDAPVGPRARCSARWKPLPERGRPRS